MIVLRQLVNSGSMCSRKEAAFLPADWLQGTESLGMPAGTMERSLPSAWVVAFDA